MIPDIAIEIDADHIAAARLTWRGAEATVTAHAIEPLAPGIVTPALAATNITDVPAVARALTQALSRLGARTRRVALVVPDTVAKVSLIRFDTVPQKAGDLQELVRWQIKKTAPFPIEDGIVTFTPGARLAEGAHEFVVAVARRDNIAQYEEVCTLAGVHAGLVDLATFSIVNGVLASRTIPAGDWLLVHVTSSYTTLTVIRDGNVILFRNRADDAEGTLADLVHQTSMYYEDRLQGAGFNRVMLAGGAAGIGGAAGLRRNLEERLGLTVEAVDPRSAAALIDRINASPELLDALAPLVGILVRDGKAA